MRLHGNYDIAIAGSKSPRIIQIARGLAALGAFVLAGCVGALETPPRPAAPDDSQAKAASFPNLSSVPGRPAFPDTLLDRSKLASDLETSLSATRYRGELARYETGLLAQPPIRPVVGCPAPLPTPRPPEADEAKKEQRSAAERYVTETVFRETNDGDLSDFLDSLERGNLAVRRAAPRQPADAGRPGFQED